MLAATFAMSAPFVGVARWLFPSVLAYVATLVSLVLSLLSLSCFVCPLAALSYALAVTAGASSSRC